MKEDKLFFEGEIGIMYYTPSIILKESGKRESYQLTIIDSICDSLVNFDVHDDPPSKSNFVLLNIFSM
jgi:hypothetical protein